MTDTTNPKDLLGVKKAALRFVPHALRLLAVPAMALGARKYGPMNWRTAPVRLTVYLEAIDRHLAAFADGQDNDPESGASHLSHAAACLGIIADADALGNLIDDRFEPGPAAVMLDRLDTTKTDGRKRHALADDPAYVGAADELPPVRPIARLKTMAEAVADGDLDEPVRPATDAEMANLIMYGTPDEPTVNERAIAESEGL